MKQLSSYFIFLSFATVFAVSCAKQTHPLHLSPGKPIGTLDQVTKNTETDSVEKYVEQVQNQETLDFNSVYKTVRAKFAVLPQRAINRQRPNFPGRNNGQPRNRINNTNQRNMPQVNQRRQIQSVNDDGDNSSQQPRRPMGVKSNLDHIEYKLTDDTLSVAVVPRSGNGVSISGKVSKDDSVKVITSDDKQKQIQFACLDKDQCNFALIILKLLAKDSGKVMAVRPYLLIKSTGQVVKSNGKSNFSELTTSVDVAAGKKVVRISLDNTDANIFTSELLDVASENPSAAVNNTMTNGEGDQVPFSITKTPAGKKYFTLSPGANEMKILIGQDFNVF
jgi:hypothetical protein